MESVVTYEYSIKYLGMYLICEVCKHLDKIIPR